MENTKKTGKKYTRKELLANGWTNSLIDRFLTQHGTGKYAYFKAAEVAEITQTAKFKAALQEHHEYVTQRQRIAESSTEDRANAAIHFASLLTQYVYELILDEEEQILVNLWHTTFIRRMRNSLETSMKTPSQVYDDLCNKDMEHYRRRFFRTADRAWIMHGHPLAEKFAQEYASLLVRIAKIEIESLRSRDIDSPLSSFLGAPGFIENYPEKKSIYCCYLMYFASAMIPQDLIQILSAPAYKTKKAE